MPRLVTSLLLAAGLLLPALLAGCRLQNRPDAPAVPVGPDSVELDSAYVFRTWVTDGTGHGLAWVRFDWGDGDTSPWCGSGETAEYSHSWRDGGVFVVRAQARDDRAEWSEWSAPCSVSAVVPPYPFRLVDSVAVTGDPLYDALVLPDGDYVYVTNDLTGALSVVRTSDMLLIAQIPFNEGWSSEGQVTCSPDGDYVYATCFRDNWVAVVRTADQTVVDSLMVDDEVTSVAVTPDGRRLYMAVVDGSGFIVVVRLPDDAIEDTIFFPKGGAYITSLRVSPDGARIFAAGQEGYVYAVGLADKTIDWQSEAWVSHAPGGIVLHPTGDRLYVVVDDQCVSVLETDAGTLVDSISLVPYVWSADIAADGSFLYAACDVGEDGGAVTVVRTSDNKVVRVIGMPTDVYDVAPSPDGQRLYVAGGNGRLYVLSR